MKKGVDLDEVAIISDFDGTISCQDTNELLFKVFGNKDNEKITNLYKTGKIGTRECMQKNFQQITMRENDYSKFIQSDIEIDYGFRRFYQEVKSHNIPFIVVSGGVTNGIRLLLEREDIEIVEVYANKLNFNGEKISIDFLHETVNCSSKFGPCGNCKLLYLEQYHAQGKRVVFIGDGLTDRCIAENADIVFAKGDLRKYCLDHSIEHIKYSSFDDIRMILFNSETNE